MKFINKHKSLNYDKRCKRLSIKYIIIHYTAMRTDVEAINYLCDKNNQVSSHFLINRIGKIFNLVNVNYRAWHAGKSYWKKERDINSNSIGIEIDNSGYHLDFENYNSLQFKAIVKLLIFLKKNIKSNHTIFLHIQIYLHIGKLILVRNFLGTNYLQKKLLQCLNYLEKNCLKRLNIILIVCHSDQLKKKLCIC